MDLGAYSAGMRPPRPGSYEQSPHMSPSAASHAGVTVAKTALSVVWAILPLVTLGFLTPAIFLHATIKMRSRMVGISAAAYTIGAATLLATSDSDGGPRNAAFGTALVLNMFVATGHALAIRRRMFFSTPQPSTAGNDQAVALARHRRRLREEARALVQRDPALAAELRVGRPELPRNYDDGGVVDMNHAPGHVIATVPGMTPELVERILQAREAARVFSSAEELSVTADLPVDLNDELAEYSVYLP